MSTAGNNMDLQRVPFTAQADNRLRMMKARTGITPNILCRIGFALSLEEPGQPTVPAPGEDLGREINRYTLLGPYDGAFIALLKAWVNERFAGSKEAVRIGESPRQP